MSGKMYADTSNMQVLDYTGLLLRLNENINFNTAMQNKQAIHGLINQLENLLDPYKDKIFYDEFEAMCKTPIKSGKTPAQQKNIESAFLEDLMTAKYRALLRLAYRKRLDRKSTRLNSSHSGESRMPSSA